MNNYIFRTTTTMKEYNREKYWIDSNIIREKQINADTLKEALEQYKKLVIENDYIFISQNAIDTRQPMYIDIPNGVKQIGFVITGQTEIENKKQYIDLWVDILTVIDTDFTEEEQNEKL